ncbi:pp-loop family protein [Colletotrichum camelliae]|nr:pp-loop family protein [Colletotrichum camelliae]
MSSLITPSQILHPVVPKHITFLEFFNVVRATAPPRFPHARVVQPRRIALAVSGGLDSMALAVLFNQLREINPLMRIADNPLSKITAVIVDHGLRPESADEALAVDKELRNLKHIAPVVQTVNWEKLGVEGDPSKAPNLESLARKARYRAIGKVCRERHIESVFLAHHEDDNYETVLMRLLAGHGSRGLRGIAPQAPIPECGDIHGVHESGHVDDQAQRLPMVSFRPSRRDWNHIRAELHSELDLALSAAELRAGLQLGWHETPYTEQDPVAATASARARARAASSIRNLARIPIEDAGVMIYRPLLGFSKDRLRTTCERHRVRWFEDRTNADPTLTLRNAVRHMVKGHTLPRALGKENVLRLAARCDARIRAQEAEAERWVKRAVEGDFEPNVGTLLVSLPSMAVPRPRRHRHADKQRREARISHRRTIAALIVRRLLSFVSPDKQYAQLSSLQTVVARLFPALYPSTTSPPSPRKAFNQAAVLFLPVPSSPSKWYLVREPYPSLLPHPSVSWVTTNAGSSRNFPQFPPGPRPGCTWVDEHGNETTIPSNGLTQLEFLHQLHREPLPVPAHKTSHWHTWRRFQLWDGRFWVRVRGKVRSVFTIQPFSTHHAKAFRESLGSDEERVRLEGTLKRFAPGKVRYTLPALYAVNRDEDTGQEVLRMLALPTLGIQVPGMERWVKVEARYRRVELELLERGDEERFSGLVEVERPRRRSRRRRRRVTTAAALGPMDSAENGFKNDTPFARVRNWFSGK